MGDSDEGVSESAYELTLWGAFLLIFVILNAAVGRSARTGPSLRLGEGSGRNVR